MFRQLFAAFLCGVSLSPLVNISHLSIGVENTVPGNKGRHGFVLLQNLQHCMEPMQSSKDLHSPNCKLFHSVARLGGLRLKVFARNRLGTKAMD